MAKNIRVGGGGYGTWSNGSWVGVRRKRRRTAKEKPKMKKMER
jgi:hypothetical protein